MAMSAIARRKLSSLKRLQHAGMPPQLLAGAACSMSSACAQLLQTHGDAVAGLYIWGGVGRGKTFLMDLFYETLALPAKKRIHFHRMMHEVHARLARLGDIEDPLDQVAADIAWETRVLCFDEFFVSDIGDAMMLGRLLEGLFQRGVTLLATSNSAPEDLYRDGLQRQRFLPAIESLKQHTRVVEMGDGIDYRLRLLQKAGTYLVPDDGGAREKLQHYFDECASSQFVARAIQVNGREIRACRSVPRASSGSTSRRSATDRAAKTTTSKLLAGTPR